jgi:hypothetical protein
MRNALKRAALRIPAIGRLYDHRNALLAETQRQAEELLSLRTAMVAAANRSAELRAELARSELDRIGLERRIRELSDERDSLNAMVAAARGDVTQLKVQHGVVNNQLKACQDTLSRIAHRIEVNEAWTEWIPKTCTIGLLSTVQRSGTWLTYYLFEHVNAFLTGERIRHHHFFEYYPKLNVAKAHVHAICPGFLDVCPDTLRGRWEALSRHAPGFLKNDYAGEWLRAHSAIFSPLKNPDVRIVYLYRNPLDHFVSFYDQLVTHKHRSEYLREGQSLSEFVRNGALDAYIRQFVTYVTMARKTPENILLVRYEDLMTNLKGTARSILEFWRVHAGDAKILAAVEYGVAQVAPERMRALEAHEPASLGRSAENPQGVSHLVDGRVGKWRERLTEDDISWTKGRLAQFAIDESHFDFGTPVEAAPRK